MGHADPARPAHRRAGPAALLGRARGCRGPRVGAAGWGLLRPLLARGEERGRRELNGARRRVGLPDLEHTHGGISRQLALVATFPQLEYPRHDRDPCGARDRAAAVGAARSRRSSCRRATTRWCWWRRARRRTRRHAHAAGRARGPGRRAACGCSAPPTGASPPCPLRVPANARVVDWLSYARTMPRCAAVVCHAGHGTVARALASGVPVIGCPAAGDMAENAARLAWAGCGDLAAPAAGHRARDQAGGAQAAGGAALRGARGRATGVVASATTVARWRREAVEGLAGLKAPGVGLEPTTSR